MKEYRDLTADPLQDTITAGPVSEDNMLEWEALIQGPEGTPYVSSILKHQGTVILISSRYRKGGSLRQNLSSSVFFLFSFGFSITFGFQCLTGKINSHLIIPLILSL